MTQIAPDITPLAEIMRKLRDRETGCEWDKEQSFKSIAPYTIEEAYEVADAIERCDMEDLKDELGDLLLQVVFHSQMADEERAFNLQNVIDSICDKMTRRHPHIFANDASNTVEEIRQNWEQIKAQERNKKPQLNGVLAGVALGLPALMRAQKLQKRAAVVGFDWPDASGACDKITEELLEFTTASDQTARFEEMGDLLFAVVNLCRFHEIDAELALKAGNAKFERRFAGMEALAGKTIDGMSLDEMEQLWQSVKQAEKTVT